MRRTDGWQWAWGNDEAADGRLTSDSQDPADGD